MGRRGKDDIPEKPFCFSDEVVYRIDSDVCQKCPYYVPCSVSLDVDLEMSRKEMEEEMAQKRLSLKDAREAVREVFPDASKNAVNLSYSRRLKKHG